MLSRGLFVLNVEIFTGPTSWHPKLFVIFAAGSQAAPGNVQKCVFNEILFMMNVKHNAIADVRTERTFSTVSRLSRMKVTLSLSHVWRKSVDIQLHILMKMWSLWTRKVSLHRIYLIFKCTLYFNNFSAKLRIQNVCSLLAIFFLLLDPGFLVSTLWVM